MKDPEMEQSLLLNLLRNDPRERERAMDGLWDIAVADRTKASLVVLAARSCLADPSWPVRETAIETLAQIGSGRDAAFVARLWQDESWVVRATVYSALASLSGKRYLKRIIRGLDDPDSGVRKYAAVAVSKVLGQDCGPILEPGYQSEPDLNGKIGFAFGLTVAGHAYALEYLVSSLSGETERIKGSAQSALKHLAEQGSIVVDSESSDESPERKTYRLSFSTK